MNTSPNFAHFSGGAFHFDPGSNPPAHMPMSGLEKVLRQLDAEVVDHFTGCGSPIPESIKGCRVLDLGCGTGRDVYLCAALAGPKGFVMGLDFEDESLMIARRHVESTMEKFGHTEPNVAFRKGSIGALGDAGLAEEDFDVVISNRAFNLADKKLKGLREVYRVLKPGGEFYFSDVFSDRRLPEGLDRDEAFAREHLDGAVYLGDFLRLVRKAGFCDPRIVSMSPLRVTDGDLAARLDSVGFSAVTLRLFKVVELEEGEEDYGQSAIYQGTVEGFAHHFILDGINRFDTGKSVRVGGNTARIIKMSRFSPHFTICGDTSRHFGPFVPPK